MDEERPKTTLRPPSKGPWALVALALVAVVGGALWWLLGTSQAPAPLPAPAAPVAEGPASATGPAVDEARQRSLLEAITSNPLVRRLLAEGDVVRRWALVTENVAGDVVPRKPLSLLAPRGEFTVIRRGGQILVDPASYARFDAVGDAVASIDVEAFAAAYGVLRPALEAAYRGLGYPDGSIDRVAARALSRIERAAPREGDLALVEGPGTSFAFADPKLESLGDVEKQLLRMGPRNGRILQEKARDIARALGFATGAP